MKRYGPHAVTNRSIEHPEVDALASLAPVSILYSDPPWGDGAMKFWATMAQKQAGATVKALPYTALLDRLMDLGTRYVNGYVMLETGKKWEDQLRAVMQDHFHNVRAFTLTYRDSGKDRPSSLVIGSTRADLTYPGDPTGLSGYKAVRDSIAAVSQPGQVVLDPCCGFGHTARAALDLGLYFRGNELNAKRLEKTEARLARVA